MANKLFDLEIEEIKNLQLQLSKLNEDREEKAAKAEKLSGEVFAMRQRRDELEKIQKNASALLLNGSLNEVDFAANKKEMSILYEEIDSKDELFNLFDKAVNDDYVKQYSSLINKINSKKNILLQKNASQIAFDIVDQCELQLKQLLAIFPEESMSGDHVPIYHLGKSLNYSLTHEKDGTLKKKDPDENKKLIANIFNEFGVEP